MKKIITLLLFISSAYGQDPFSVLNKNNDSKKVIELEKKIIILEKKVDNLEKKLISVTKKAEQNIPIQENSQTNLQTEEQKDYENALAIFKEGNYEVAEDLFSEFIEKYPSGKLISNAYFWYSESFANRKIYDKAAIFYLKGYKLHPKGAKAPDSLLKLALALHEIGKDKESCATLNLLEQEFKNRSSASKKRADDFKNKINCK